MTTNWDRLWLNELELEGGIWEEFKLWMEEVKAEGDSLKEKAENWDNLRSELKPLDTLFVKGEPYLFISTATYEYYKSKAETWDKLSEFKSRTHIAYDEWARCRKKLEAIKKLTEVHGLVVPISEILRILEGKDA